MQTVLSRLRFRHVHIGAESGGPAVHRPLRFGGGVATNGASGLVLMRGSVTITYMDESARQRWVWPPEPQPYYRWGRAAGWTALGSTLLCGILVLAQGFLAPPTPIADSARPVKGPVGTPVVVRLGGSQILYPGLDRDCRWRTLTAAAVTNTEVRLTATYAELPLADCVRFRSAPGFLNRQLNLSPVPINLTTIVDAITGAPVPYLDSSTALGPSGALAGWVSTSSDLRPEASDFGGPGAATLAEVFHGTGESGGPSTDDQLWIIQTRGGWHPPASLVTTPVTVRGRPGRAAPGIIVWSERGMTVAVRWDSMPRPAPGPAVLEAIAANLITGVA